jgi:hypothetical protein
MVAASSVVTDVPESRLDPDLGRHLWVCRDPPPACLGQNVARAGGRRCPARRAPAGSKPDEFSDRSSGQTITRIWPSTARCAGLPPRRERGLRSGDARAEAPTAQDAAWARQILLDGLTHDVDLFEMFSQLAPLPTRSTGPGSTGLTRSTWPGLQPRFLPDCSLAGRDRRKLQFAVPGRGGAARRGRRRLAGRGRLVADRRLLALRRLRGGRLHPDGRRPSRPARSRGLPPHRPGTVPACLRAASLPGDLSQPARETRRPGGGAGR